MMAKYNLVSITSYFAPAAGLMMKNRMRRLREVDHRLSESRIGEDALNLYVSMLEARLLPSHKEPALSRKRVMGE